MEEPDPQVIRSASAGDRRAFEAIVRAYQPHVWRFLRHQLGDGALAEDVAQETFLRLYQRLPTFAFRSRFSTWVFQVARNAGIDALRGRMRRQRLAEAASRPPTPTGPEVGVELRAALASLTPKLRESILLVEVLGLTYRECGAVLGVPEGTVKSRVFDARQRLIAWRAEGEERSGAV